MRLTKNDQLMLEQAYRKIIIEEITDEWFREGAFKTYKKPAREKYEVAKTDGTLTTLEGPQQYKAGYYIVTGPKGEKYSMPPEKFHELKDDNGDGTASPKKIIKLAKLADSNGVVKTSWGQDLQYSAGEDYIVKHGPGDYGVVKADIFNQTYDKPTTISEGIFDRFKKQKPASQQSPPVAQGYKDPNLQNWEKLRHTPYMAEVNIFGKTRYFDKRDLMSGSKTVSVVDKTGPEDFTELKIYQGLADDVNSYREIDVFIPLIVVHSDSYPSPPSSVVYVGEKAYTSYDKAVEDLKTKYGKIK